MAPKAMLPPEKPISLTVRETDGLGSFIIEGGGLRAPWLPPTICLGGRRFMQFAVNNYNLALLLAGKVNHGGERLLSRLGVLDRILAARNQMQAEAFKALRQDLEETQLESSGLAAKPISQRTLQRRALHHLPEWDLLPQVYVVEARLAHRPMEPLRCHVLKGKVTESLWMNVDMSSMQALQNEMSFVLRRRSEAEPGDESQGDPVTPPRRRNSSKSGRSSPSLGSSTSPSQQSPKQYKAAACGWREKTKCFVARVWNGHRLVYKTFRGTAEIPKEEARRVALEWVASAHRKPARRIPVQKPTKRSRRTRTRPPNAEAQQESPVRTPRGRRLRRSSSAASEVAESPNPFM